jgi:hypothetical protein
MKPWNHINVVEKGKMLQISQQIALPRKRKGLINESRITLTTLHILNLIDDGYNGRIYGNKDIKTFVSYRTKGTEMCTNMCLLPKHS